MPKIILSMIVRNEAHVIKRCLDSVKDIIDGFYIVDTGSTDDTVGIIYGELKDLPGEVVHSPWTDNFALHRNEALEKIPKNCYALCIDADDELGIYPHFKKDELTELAYALPNFAGDCRNYRVILFRPDGLKWVKVRHERVVGMETASFLNSLAVKVNGDGARSKTKKFEGDIKAIENWIAHGGDVDGTDIFNLAQSYKDAGQHEKAIEVYQDFIGHYNDKDLKEMRCVAAIMCAAMESIGKDQRTQEFLEQAMAIDNTRIEPYVYLTEHFLKHNRLEDAVKVSAKGIQIPRTFHYLNESMSYWTDARYKIHELALHQFKVYKARLNQHCTNNKPARVGNAET